MFTRTGVQLIATKATTTAVSSAQIAVRMNCIACSFACVPGIILGVSRPVTLGRIGGEGKRM